MTISTVPASVLKNAENKNYVLAMKDGVSFLYPLILSSKGLILISPSHNYDVTAWMKAFIDRFYCFYDFENTRPRAWSSRLSNQGRKAVIIGICEQEGEENMGFTIDSMEKPLLTLGHEVVEKIPVYGVLDRGAVKNDESLINKMYQVGQKLGEAIKVVNNKQPSVRSLQAELTSRRIYTVRSE